MYKAVIFDMDGVICHTNPWHSKAFDVFFQKRGLFPSEEEYNRHMHGKNNGYIFSHFLGRKIKGQELMDFENEKEGLFRELYADHVQCVDGFLEFFHWIKLQNVPIGVATSAPTANREMILGKLGIESDFSSLLASEDVSKHKPDPEVYLKSAQNLGVDPKDCLVFEDSFSGMTAAKRAEMDVVGVLTTHEKKDLPRCCLLYTSPSPRD